MADPKQMPDPREYPGRPIVGVGGVVIDDDRALLVRRGGEPLKGEWSIPGGTLETGETLVEGVEREMAEETGLRVRVLEQIEVFERIMRDDQGRVRYHFVIVDYLCENAGGTAEAASDVTHIAWAREDQLATYNLTPTATRILKKAFVMHRSRSGR